jgi:hypothetical protein
MNALKRLQIAEPQSGNWWLLHPSPMPGMRTSLHGQPRMWVKMIENLRLSYIMSIFSFVTVDSLCPREWIGINRQT